MKNYGELIKVLREEKGLSQLALAKEINISSQNINRWERGEVLPSIDFCIKLSNFFDCTVGYLLGVEDENGRAIPQDLPKKDLDLLKAFHKLRPSEQETIMIQIGALAEKVNV